MFNYEGESKSNPILFRTGIITNTGTCIIHQNEAGPLWITILLLHIGESKSNAILFRTGIITNTGTCTIHQNKAGPLWITSLLLHIVTVSLNSNVPLSNESMYPSPVKFCWMFFEPLLHYRFHFLVTRIMFASLRPHERGFERQTLFQWWWSEICSEEVAQRTVNRILWGRDTCSHSKVEHCYWQKQWICGEVGMRSTEDQLHFDVWYMFLCW